MGYPSPFPCPDTHTANAVLRLDKTKAELAQHLHAACFSPVKSTFVQAIKNNQFLAWPGLTADLITKYLPLSTATVKGHIKQEFKNIRSTQTAITIPDETDTDRKDATILDPQGERLHECYITVTRQKNKALAPIRI
jgi:hypothetical protein